MSLFLDTRQLREMGMAEDNIRTFVELVKLANLQGQIDTVSDTTDSNTSVIETNSADIAALQSQVETLAEGDPRVETLSGANGLDHRITTVDTAVQDSDSVIFADATGGAIQIDLPSLSERRFTVKKIDASANAVTVAGTIDGATDFVLSNPMQSVTIGGFQSGWWVL